MEKLLRFVLSCVLLAPPSLATVQAKGKSDPGAVSEVGTDLMDVLSIKQIGCSYISAYDEDDHLQIVAMTTEEYFDGHTVKNPLPQVFHDRAHAYGACGAWQDMMIRQQTYAREAQKAKK